MLCDVEIRHRQVPQRLFKYLASLMPADQGEVSGMSDARKITDVTTGKVVAYIGVYNSRMVVHLPRPLNVTDFAELSEYINKVQ